MFLGKIAKKRIEQAMPKAVKKLYDQGEAFTLRIERYGRPLKRWGNTAEIKVKNSKVISNSLIDQTDEHWEDRETNACRAIDYLLYGERADYDIVFMVDGKEVPGRGNNCGYYFVRFQDGFNLFFDRFRDVKRFLHGRFDRVDTLSKHFQAGSDSFVVLISNGKSAGYQMCSYRKGF